MALVEILRRIESQPYHWPVGRTTFQKIAFVATEEGLPTGLTHHHGSYGPFSAEVKPLLSRLVNNGLLREERLGRVLVLRSGPTLDDARRAFQSPEHQCWEPIIERVADLFMRMNTERAEVAATVLFAGRRLAQDRRAEPSEHDVLEAVMAWKQKQRPPLTPADVAGAVRNLAALAWLRVTPARTCPFRGGEEPEPAGARIGEHLQR